MRRCVTVVLLALLLGIIGSQSPAQAAVDCPIGGAFQGTMVSINVHLSQVPNDQTPPKVATVPAVPETTWQWFCPSAPGVYYLSLSAVGAGGQEGIRGDVYVFTVGGVPLPPPPAPILLSLVQNVLTWRDNSTDELSFTIERKVEHCAGPGPFAPLSVVGPNVTTYTDVLGIVPGSTYAYRAKATNANGDSAWSNCAERTVPVPPSFVLGATVKVNTLVGQVLNVRATPGGIILGTQPRGATGTILAGPVNVSGVTWWQIQYAAITGWCSQTYLLPVAAP